MLAFSLASLLIRVDDLFLGSVSHHVADLAGQLAPDSSHNITDCLTGNLGEYNLIRLTYDRQDNEHRMFCYDGCTRSEPSVFIPDSGTQSPWQHPFQ